MSTKTEDKATARPWKLAKYKNEDVGSIYSGEKLVCNVTEISQADASLIVKAVNNHEALLEACREALASLEFAEQRYGYRTTATDKIKQALNATQTCQNGGAHE